MSITPEAIGTISTPNTFSTVVQPTTSLKNARIGFTNLLTTSTTIEAKKMLIPNTYERYRPTAGAKTVKFQLSSPAEVDFVGIAAHNAGTQDGGVDILVQYATTIGGALTTIENVEFADNNAVMPLFTAVTIAEIAITFNASTLGLELGVIYAGKALEMLRPIFGGHSPIDLSSVAQYQSTTSESGQFLGRNINRQGLATDFSWQHLDDVWYRDNFQPFVESAKRLPFFIKWRPDLYDVAAFGYTTSDIKPSNMGGGSKLMTVSISVKAHSDAS